MVKDAAVLMVNAGGFEGWRRLILVMLAYTTSRLVLVSLQLSAIASACSLSVNRIRYNLGKL